MKERLTNQEKQSREKKQRIYKIAMKMFSDYGYDQTTIRDICSKAGITTSTFYNFFTDKDGLLLQFYYEILAKGARHLDLTPDNLKHPYQSICNFFIETAEFLDSFSKDVARRTVFATKKLLDGNYKTLKADNANKAIEAFLNQGKVFGTVDVDTDTKHVAEYLLMTASGITTYWINQTDDESYVAVASRLFPTAFSAVTDEIISV